MKDLSKIDTTISLGNLEIHQPVTALTALVIAILCIYFYFTLKNMSNLNKSSNYWMLFFLFLGIATVLGACSHAFYLVPEGWGYKSFWLTAQLFDGFCIYAAQQATLYSALRFSKKTTVCKISYNAQLLLFNISVFVFQNFIVAVIGFAVGLIPVMILHFKSGKNQTPDLWIAYGILISFLTAFVHLFKIGVHIYFNHLDVAHVFAMVNISVMYVGIKQKAKASILS